jgi:hypothetical protein
MEVKIKRKGHMNTGFNKQRLSTNTLSGENSVLKELYRTLKKGGEINWIVADAALYGVHIKTQKR